MTLNDPAKILLLGLIVVCVTVLMVTGTLSEVGGIGIMGGIAGYLTGNGRLSQLKHPPSGAFAPIMAPHDVEVAEATVALNQISRAQRTRPVSGPAEHSTEAPP